MMLENLGAFFGDFGQQATLAGSPVVGLFDDAHVAAFGGLVESVGPTFLSQTSASVGDAFVLGPKEYRVAAVERDGAGLFLLRLK